MLPGSGADDRGDPVLRPGMSTQMRTLVAVTSTIASLGLVFSASASPSHVERHGPSRLGVEGIVSDWDADAPSITVEDPDVHGGTRAVRRVLRRLPELDVAIGPRTRIVTDDDEGGRERISADDLFAELDASADDLDVEVQGQLAAPVDPAAGSPPVITAKRIVLHVPAPDQADDGSDLPDDGPPPPDPGAVPVL